MGLVHTVTWMHVEWLFFQVGLAQMRSHTAACSKYQEYIEEGVRTSAQTQPPIVR